ncbi:integrase [Pseudoalteromonas citrea]|uniref:Integrase n=1 Tax=Pseudoalteromonas citrea TaxID=43655 RepID=A0A5S3XLM3_9GAMM|nr:tyrosine-type recombinase/integrase [Pseudoalteromonas citrea]TMP41292.1 integrase [Pseudoalteromonas citrea]TMP55118.1 integrase [Pseudoalteromonas citrea]
MPKFAKASTQAKNVIKGLTKTKRIKSLGTARNYMQALKTVASWSKDIGMNGIQSMTIEQAQTYLDYRAEIVGQKALDMERQAIQAMMQLNGKLAPKQPLYRIKSSLDEIKRSRAYTSNQAEAISNRQTAKHQLATQIAYAAGLRAHELLTLAKASERSPDKRHALKSKWQGRSGELYTVQGKGGLIRHVILPTSLASMLEQQRLEQPITIVDRKINYLQLYDIAGGKKWSDSFSKASNRTLLFSTGAHGLRHSYAQERMVELKSLGFSYETALETVSQEIGHFRADITKVYLN